MHYTKLNPVTNCVFSEENVYALKKSNGLCYNCNRNQELMILQLASFVPDNEENFDEEVEKYRQSLEKSYRLCAHCERVVKRSLNQVKSHIVGSKMSAKLSEKLHNNVIPPTKKWQIIQIGIYAIFFVTLINFWMTLSEFRISHEKLTTFFGSEMTENFLSALSYVLAIKSLIIEFVYHTLDNPILQGAWIYMTTGAQFLQKLTGNFDWTCFSTIDCKEFLNISTMLAIIMLIILFEGQNLGSQLTLLFFWAVKTLLHNHEMLVEPIETEFLHVTDLICAFIALGLSYRNLNMTKVTFKHCDDLNKSFHKICAEIEEDSDPEIDDSCSNLMNSTLKSQNASFYAENHFSRTPSVISTSFKSPSEMNFSRLSSKNVMDNVSKLTQLNLNQSQSSRSFNTAIENPFYNHMNLDRQTPSSVLSYRGNAIISPPKLNRESVVGEASWVAGGFWTTSPKKSIFPANADFVPIMSRTSSQSSGFESQPGAGSRENSIEKTIIDTIRPIRPHPIYPSTFNTSSQENSFTKPLSSPRTLSISRISLASRQSNRSLFGETNFNDTSSLYSNYRSNGRFVTPSTTMNSSRSIFNFKKFSTDLPQF